MSVLNLVPHAVGQSGPTTLYAEISTSQPSPASFDDPLYVIIPDWNSSIYFTIRDWPACHGTTLPPAGNVALVEYDDQNNLRCTWWSGTTKFEFPSLTAGDWIPLTLPSGWTSAGGYTPACRISGSTVQLSGQLTNNSGVTATTTVATLPPSSGFFPASQIRLGITSNLNNTSYFPGALVTNAGAGALVYYGPASGAVPVAISLDGLSFRVI